MESTEEHEPELLHQILPPRLEDAGLEDCALPPESIKEAFFKAATAVKSRAAPIFSDEDEDEGDCDQDPWPTAKDAAAKVIGIEPENEPHGHCTVEKGGGMRQMAADEVKFGSGGVGVEEMVDKVVVEEGGLKLGEGGKACVDQLHGLNLRDDEKNGGDEEDEEKKDGGKPTLG